MVPHPIHLRRRCTHDIAGRTRAAAGRTEEASAEAFFLCTIIGDSAEGVTNEAPAARLARYLDGVEPYDSIHLMLFSHGVESVGLASIDRWRKCRARGDSAASTRTRTRATSPPSSGTAPTSSTSARYPIPDPVNLAHLTSFLEQVGSVYAVRWTPSP